MDKLVILLVIFCFAGAIIYDLQHPTIQEKAYDDGYRAGQIDAIEGKVKYQPTTQTVYVERE